MSLEFMKYPHLERFGNLEVTGIEHGITYVFPKIDGQPPVAFRRKECPFVSRLFIWCCRYSASFSECQHLGFGLAAQGGLGQCGGLAHDVALNSF